MAFHDFTLPDIKKKFGIVVGGGRDLFGGVPELPLPAALAAILLRNLPLALNLNTEKARSEMLISPMLLEVKFAHPEQLSVFSGIDLTVDVSVGLSGRCDFVLARSPEQLALTAPAVVIVEAKSENIVAGIPQCLAEMVAAQRFNRGEGAPDGRVYGVVTTGLLWRFLVLDGTAAGVDAVEYPLQQPEKIYGILTHLALGTA